MAAFFTVGAIVRLTRLPPGLRDDDELATKSLFEACIGKTFPIVGIEQNRVELHVGDVLSKPAYMHSIYVETEFLELVKIQA